MESEGSTASIRVERCIDVLFICDEWKSSKGGVSTFNREFAVNLAKRSSDSIAVHCYVLQSDEKDREDAQQKGVNLITAKRIPGCTDPQDWLKFPPPELPYPDVVVGHGRKFGPPAIFILKASKCKWVQFVHVFCEDLGKHKITESAVVDTIEENEKKHKSEIELCRAADTVFAVGSRLQQKYSRSLRDGNVEIIAITPGILEDFSSEPTPLTTVPVKSKKFNVSLFGRADFEDLNLKGYDIVGNAIGSLGKKFELTFVGSPTGEHRKIEQWFLDNTCISRNQITIRSYCNKQDELKMMFRESDLVALPSRTEGYGFVALEAISAGVPVIVTDESGIAEALEKVEGGESVIVASEDSTVWAQKIQQLSSQSPEERENNAKLLRENYKKTHSWGRECEKFRSVIQTLVKEAQSSSQNESQSCVRRSDDAPEPIYDELVIINPPWYFGKITRDAAETMLQSYCPGTFLVRDSVSDPRPGTYVLSVMHEDRCRHHKIETLHDGYLVVKGCEDRRFPSLVTLVDSYARSQEFEKDIPLKLVPLVKENVQCDIAAVLTGRLPLLTDANREREVETLLAGTPTQWTDTNMETQEVPEIAQD